MRVAEIEQELQRRGLVLTLTPFRDRSPKDWLAQVMWASGATLIGNAGGPTRLAAAEDALARVKAHQGEPSELR
jgi:hypothetical protein